MCRCENEIQFAVTLVELLSGMKRNIDWIDYVGL